MNNLIPVNFHDDTLNLVEHNGEPTVVMKTIVESLGLDWSRQYRKIIGNKERWGGVALKAIPASGKGGAQNTLCIPLRKLPGYLMTINPLKVATEKRAKIVQYQNECDNVLWEYWNNRTTPERASLPMRAETIRVLTEINPDGTTTQRTLDPDEWVLRLDAFREMVAKADGAIHVSLNDIRSVMADVIAHQTEIWNSLYRFGEKHGLDMRNAE